LGSWERFNLTSGIIYFTEDADGGYGSRVTGPGLAALSIPDLTFLTRNFQSVSVESMGVYAQGEYTPPILDDNLRVILGARYSDDKKDMVRTVEVPLTGSPLPRRGEVQASRWDPAITLQYDWTDDFNTYVRYARGYRAGGANVRSLGFIPYEDEEVVQWEVGLKSQLWDRRVTLNASLFHSVKRNAQLDVLENPAVNPSATTTVNAPVDWKTRGFELESSVRPTDNLTFGFNFAYLDADLPPFDNPLTPAADVSSYLTIVSPEYTGAVTADYAIPVSPGEVLLHADYTYTSDYYTGSERVPAGVQPNFPPSDTRELGARITWRDLPFGSMFADLSVYGKNLLDHDGISHGFAACARGRGFCTFPTAPRTVFVELRVRL
jgi:iron complex outermembrane recepter protein